MSESSPSSVEQHQRAAPRNLGFGVVTISDSRGPAEDTSGDRIRALILAAGYRVVGSELVKDEEEAIVWAVRGFVNAPGVDVIVTTGGTGFAPRDVTVPALSALFDAEVPGFGELFRMLSYQQVGAAAMLSRATAGVLAGRVIFVLPGSPKAVELAMSALILPEAAHLSSHARRLSPAT